MCSRNGNSIFIGGKFMENTITTESMELLLEEIVDAVESTSDRDIQFEMVKTILEDNGIVSVRD